MKKASLIIVLLIGLGNITYAQTVTIGTQVWMTKNLDVATFRNGDPIPQAKTVEEWRAAGDNKQPAWCYYNNDPANGAKYGKLYNWYAVNDPRGLAPVGWHVPSDGEWTTLTNYLGEQAADKLKSTSGWYVTEDIACANCASWNQEYRNKVPCHICKDTRVIGKKKVSKGNGNNSSGFSGLPGGYRYYVGAFGPIGKYGYWWSSTEDDTGSAWYRGLDYYSGSVVRSFNYKKSGFSVRCLRD